VAAARSRIVAVRFARPLLAAFAAVALVACGGGNHKAAVPLPVAQRFLTAADAPGTKPDPIEKRQTTVKFNEFIAALGQIAINPKHNEMVKVFRKAGFKGAGVDTRYYGQTHKRTAPHLNSSFIRLDSKEGATSALNWLETDERKPCRMTCDFRISSFHVDHIADARGVHRIATAQDIKNGGTKGERPLDLYWIGFSEGALVYTVELHGSPGSVSKEQAQNIARAYHKRLTAN
jgi:hypothetical protein